MDSTNSMRPPVAQPQSSEGRQRKRPRILTQSPSMSSQESDVVNSSHHMEVGSASHGSCIPIPQASSRATPPKPATVQRRPNPNRQQKEKKKNPKSIQELVQEMYEQKCMFMKKKLEIQRAYHDETLRFLREQSEKLFALESRRLDLEFMRMEQQREHRLDLELMRMEHQREHRLDLELMRMEHQREHRREDSRIRKLALQVELEKLHGNC